MDARDHLHLAFNDTGCATSHLRQAARNVDALLTLEGIDPESTDKLIMIGDQLIATSDMVLGFTTAITDIDAKLRGARHVARGDG
jgi:hypothetical protein